MVKKKARASVLVHSLVFCSSLMFQGSSPVILFKDYISTCVLQKYTFEDRII